VETPVLSAAGNTDANIESFSLEFRGPVAAGPGVRWLRTSPEFFLKRLLAAGVGNCYELGRVFRNGEAGRLHNPEFTMLEWYRIGWTHHQLMDECAELVRDAMRLAGRSVSVRESSFRQLYHDSIGLDPLTASEAELRAPLAVFDIQAEGLTRDDWLDLLMTHMIQPTIPANLGEEKKLNPFLRADEPEMRKRFGGENKLPHDVFGAIRAAKDKF